MHNEASYGLKSKCEIHCFVYKPYICIDWKVVLSDLFSAPEFWLQPVIHSQLWNIHLWGFVPVLRFQGLRTQDLESFWVCDFKYQFFKPTLSLKWHFCFLFSFFFTSLQAGSQAPGYLQRPRWTWLWTHFTLGYFWGFKMAAAPLK